MIGGRWRWGREWGGRGYTYLTGTENPALPDLDFFPRRGARVPERVLVRFSTCFGPRPFGAPLSDLLGLGFFFRFGVDFWTISSRFLAEFLDHFGSSCGDHQKS